MEYLPPIYNAVSSKINSRSSSEAGKRIKPHTLNPKLSYSHFIHSDHKR